MLLRLPSPSTSWPLRLRSMSLLKLQASTIPLLTDLRSCREWRQRVRDDRESVGFVATMGALHAGHLSLVHHSKRANDRTVVSIFVNPAQFAPHEDLSTYPRTIDQDLRKLEEIGGVDAVFLPGVRDMYPSGIVQDVEQQRGTFVEVKGYGSEMEGRSRPLFFRGVATVVMKLFNAVEPTRAYFGQKDIQQALLLRRMCSDLLLSHPEPQNLHIVPTERDATDNLALSSRNGYLSPEERKVANTLHRALSVVKEGWETGLSKSECVARSKGLVESIRAKAGVEMRLDYIELNDPDGLEVVEDGKTRVDYGAHPVLASGALWVGRTRLIDNLILGDPALLGILDSHVEIDIVFPASTGLEEALAKPTTTYIQTRSKLAPFVQFVQDKTNGLEFKSDVMAFGFNSHGTDETWCIDTRGVLTLSIEPGTYQRLGLVGRPLPWKPHQNRHIVVLSKEVPKGEKHWSPLGAKQKSALELYDNLREKAGFNNWEVVYHSKTDDPPAETTDQSRPVQAQSQKATHVDVRIPHVNLSPPSGTDKEEREDWKTAFDEFQEWLALASMGSQRLLANDNVDPYVASYRPPEPNTIGTITHLRWSGLLHPNFTHALLQVSLDMLPADESPRFIGIITHSNTNTPVGFLNAQKPERAAPVRLARDDGEDTRSIVLTSDGRWSLTEVIGQWDSRWG